MVMKLWLKMKNLSQRYGINKYAPRNEPKYTKYRMYLLLYLLSNT